jgi:(1->4)-alpha-D-glucan 1-alpha-D-glucosylmutase
MKRIPCATYRLQFNREFTFRRAREILDYLCDLGISDLYASPLFQAGPESTHGYDTCCFKINSNLGTEGDFNQLADDLKARGFGLLLDVVPNHMSATLSNPWWFDVLENGCESRYAGFFDVDWEPVNSALRDKILLPVLEDHYGKVLESGKLKLSFGEGKFFISYYDRNFPVSRATLPAGAAGNAEKILKDFDGMPGNARSLDQLDELIRQQHYRLAFWRTASEEINYRRFFDVTEMVALKMEVPEVFDETHQLIFEWLDSGRVTGLRVDHPDGLWNPKEYLRGLQRKNHPVYVVVEKILSGDEPVPCDWPVDGTTGYDFLNRVNGLFVSGANAGAFDKIYHEVTGVRADFAGIVYQSRKTVLERSFASELNALAHRLHHLATRTRSGYDFTSSELRDALAEIIASFPVYRTYITEDIGKPSEQDAAVIRKGVGEARKRAGSDGVAFEFIGRILLLEPAEELDEPGAKAAREFVMRFQQLTGPAMAKGMEDTAFYRFNRLISLNEVGGEPDRFGVTPAEFHAANAAMAKNWPHTLLASATHDTKRGEDVRARLNVLSEMPTEWRETLARWSRMNGGRKTSVDGSPAPDANDEYLFYQTLVGAWPDDADSGNGLKQFRSRVAAFMLKAVKEAKIHTSWTETNAVYEKALQSFLERALSEDNREFLADVRHFAKRVSFFGRINSLSQTLLKMASPGVPDFYQGGELWDLNLVDPDNRRQVDYSARQRLLDEIKKEWAGNRNHLGKYLSGLLRDEKPGAMKLFLIWRALNFRKEHRELFDSGAYVPLAAAGEKADHVCAFARQAGGRAILVVAPRLVFGLTGGVEVLPIGQEIWRETCVELPGTHAGVVFRNVLTEETVVATEKNGRAILRLSEILRSFPVAVLEAAGEAPLF